MAEPQLPEVLVVVVAYGEPALLRRCLAPLLGHVEVIVVDNSSAAPTREFVTAHGGRYLDPGANVGFAAGVNRALRERAGRDVLLLNPDALIDADQLRSLQRALYAQARIGAVSPALSSPLDGSAERVGWPFPAPHRAWREAIGLGVGTDPVDFVVGAVLLLRAQALSDVGEFDERFFLYTEEADWQLRARRRGWSARVVTDITAQHQGAGTGGDPARRESYFHCSHELFIRKQYGARGWLSYRSAILVGALLRTLHLRADRRTASLALLKRYLRGPRRAQSALGPPATGRQLVVCSLEDWDEVWRRNQYLIAGLLERDPELTVLFVEPAVDTLDDMRTRHRVRRPRGLVQHRDVAGGRLWTLQGAKAIPRRFGGLADRGLDWTVLRAARRLGFQHPQLWINDPGRAPLLARTGWPALYDITDDWLLADRSPREQHRLRANEDLLLRECREVVVCSPRLAEVKGAIRAVTLVSNAVDLDRYRAPAPRPADLPPGAIVLYVGTLHEDRLDVELCQRLAQALGGLATLVFVGPDCLSPPHRQELAQCATVVVLGARCSAQRERSGLSATRRRAGGPARGDRVHREPRSTEALRVPRGPAPDRLHPGRRIPGRGRTGHDRRWARLRGNGAHHLGERRCRCPSRTGSGRRRCPPITHLGHEGGADAIGA